jgi:hypothetical protein
MGRVFLSHSSKDAEFVGELHRRLRRDGVECFYSGEDIHSGDNWVSALDRELKQCSDVVFVLSPDFCESEWVERADECVGARIGVQDSCGGVA